MRSDILETHHEVISFAEAGTPYTVTIRADNAAGDGVTASINEFTKELRKLQFPLSEHHSLVVGCDGQYFSGDRHF